jgi:hypothetical protein
MSVMRVLAAVPSVLVVVALAGVAAIWLAHWFVRIRTWVR